MTVLRSGSATDVGRVRKINQDLPLEAPNLFAVADGMGGHVGGEVAARVAVETLQLAFDREPTSMGLREAFEEANQAVWHESQSNPDVRGMGTTLTAVALVAGSDGRDTLTLGNVGDSRAYVFSANHIVQITADHSLAEERVRQGEMTEEEAAVHPQRHILTRALGIGPDVETDMWDLQLQAGDRVVLCSDGLSNEVGVEEMGRVLAAEPDPTAAAEHLVSLANDRGGSDNITVIVVDVLIGEGEAGGPSVVTALGALAAAPLIIGADGDGASAAPLDLPTGATTAVVPTVPGSDETMAVPVVDGLAPGARLGFTGDSTLGEAGQTSGEFLLGQTASVPLARTSTRVPAQPSRGPLVPAKESRAARRRRLGVPRRITLRVLLFVIMVAAIPVAAFFVIRWYAYDSWYVALSGNQIVVKQGHPGGVLWFKPKTVDHTNITTAQILPTGVAAIKGGFQEPSLSDAQNYVANLRAQYLYLHAAAQSPSGSTTVGPNGAIPDITAPPTTTTTSSTLPGQTTVPGAPPTVVTPTTAAAQP